MTYICHSGIKGMHWGVRRFQNEDGSYTEAGKQRRYSLREKIDRFKVDRTAKKDAKESARAKMYYGEGAGNRRKLINATVAQRTKNDPYYAERYSYHRERQDMASHATAATRERKTKDTIDGTRKSIRRGIKTATAIIGTASTAALAAHALGVDQEIVKFVKKKLK